MAAVKSSRAGNIKIEVIEVIEVIEESGEIGERR